MVATQHTREEVHAVLAEAEVGAVATAAGEGMRTRMMHFAVDDNFQVYLASMKGDPKTLQMTQHPSVSILVHRSEADINLSREVEISGRPVFVTDPQERENALEMTARKSPVVKYLTSTGNAGLLDCIKVVPETVKFRVFGEIVQGMPPTVIEFPENRRRTSDWAQLKRKLGLWYRELRVPFLTAALVPVLLGTAMAWALTDSFYWGYFLLALVAGLLLHAGTNIVNDYFDHVSGNDEANREFVRPFTGGSRLIQLGLLSPGEVLTLGLFCFLAGSLIGLYLAWTRGPLILVLGVIAILSGFFYTGRPFYWAKRGLGELLVGVNFGPLMVLGAYYVQTQSLSWLPVLAGLPVGLIIAAVLYINEFPDFAADQAVGKRTWVVRLGRQRAVVAYGALMAAVYISLAVGVASGRLPLMALLVALSLPLAVRAIVVAQRHYDSPFDLAPANALTIIGHLAVGLFLTVAYIWQGASAGGWIWVMLVGLISLAIVGYMYWNVERQKRASRGLKAAVGGSSS